MTSNPDRPYPLLPPEQLAELVQAAVDNQRAYQHFIDVVDATPEVQSGQINDAVRAALDAKHAAFKHLLDVLNTIPTD